MQYRETGFGTSKAKVSILAKPIGECPAPAMDISWHQLTTHVMRASLLGTAGVARKNSRVRLAGRCQPSPAIVERVVTTDAWEAEFQPLSIRPAVVDTSFVIADVLTRRRGRGRSDERRSRTARGGRVARDRQGHVLRGGFTGKTG
jgi:hypothetical protein